MRNRQLVLIADIGATDPRDAHSISGALAGRVTTRLARRDGRWRRRMSSRRGRGQEGLPPRPEAA